MPPFPLFILTDANGFTCCTRALREDASREMSRLRLMAPVQVDHWTPSGDPTNHGGWIKQESFIWT